ncbi:MAG: DNA double-strand break repair nuclease NurA [Candidatus Nanohaloarchaeota archaeon]|nr:DNA double-strand break repair nuclease NurA [Candidatus Nanohaloarchaeota archaeon]
MNFKIIKEFLYTLPKTDSVYPVLRKKDAYDIKKIEKENFRILKEGVSQDSKNIWAVDGSNKTIAESSGKAIELIRISAVSESKVITSTYIVGVVPRLESEITYDAKAFLFSGEDLGLNEIKMNAYDPSITGTAFKAQPSTVAAVLRRFLEWKMIEKIMKDYNPAMILKDGSLAMHITGEEEIAQHILDSKYPVIGVVKNSSILSNRGLNILHEISSIQPHSPHWYYDFIAKGKESSHPVYIHAVKLHPRGRIYRMEIPYHYNPASIYQTLIPISNDALYLGYPYLLAKADKIAKIKDYEVKHLMLELVDKEEFEEDMHNIFKKEW